MAPLVKHPDAVPCVIKQLGRERYLADTPTFGRRIEWTDNRDAAYRYAHKSDAKDDAYFAWLEDWPEHVEIVELRGGLDE